MELTQQQLEAHLWGAANILRNKTAGQDYKNYILSLMFYKRLCDQWENEADDAIAELEHQQGRHFTDKEKSIFRARGEHRFSIPEGSRWGDVLAVSENIGETLTTSMRAVANANDELRGVFTVDWNQPAPDASGRKLIPNEVVHALAMHFDEYDLSNKSVPSDLLGRAYEYLIKKLADELLEQLKAGSPRLFENIVIDLLVKMGYGGSDKDAARAIGRSGDGGVDGVINQDTLGIDRIYVQAKCWNDKSVGHPDIRDFIGALDFKHAERGIFITTSTFTKEVKENVDRSSKRIILIDGNELAKLMINHKVGVSVEDTFELKKIDMDYFIEE
ncbi:MAG: restriction endonuclease [Candidatus Bathyarchaeota archaeon]